ADAPGLFLRRGEESLRRAEVLQDRAAACRADPLQLVEDRAERSALAPLAMEADREAMRFVANPLQQLQGRRVPREPNGIGTTWQENLLVPLRKRDDRDAWQIEGVPRGQGGGELALPPVAPDQGRRRPARSRG